MKNYGIYEQRPGVVRFITSIQAASSTVAMTQAKLMGIKWPIIELPPQELAYVRAKEAALP